MKANKSDHARAGYHAHSHGNPGGEKSPERKYVTEWFWGCCNCGYGSMTAFTDHCLMCQQPRCQNCFWESQKIRYGDASAYYPSSSADRGNQPWQVPWSPQHSADNSAHRGLSNETMAEERAQSKNPVGTVHHLESYFVRAHAAASAIMPEYSSSPTNSPSLSQRSNRGSAIFTDEKNSIKSDTDAESEETDTEDVANDTFLGLSPSTLVVLEACLLSSFTTDLNLAARLLSRIYDLLRLNNGYIVGEPAFAAPNDVDKNSDASKLSNASSSSGTNSKGNSPQNSQSRKRGRNSGDDGSGDERGDRGFKRRGSGSGDRVDGWVDESPPPTFACHFRKKDPMKYNPLNDRKYHNCICPRIPHFRLRAIKDHFKAVHRTPQCDRCYSLFGTIDVLKEHRRRVEPCGIGPFELKEGIDDSQWEKIERVLRAKTDKGKSAVDKWYDIWDILFAGTKRPENPWSELAAQATNPLFTAESLASRFEENVERRIEQGIIRRDETYSYWMDAFRQALDMEEKPSGNNRPLDTKLGATSSVSTTLHSTAIEPNPYSYQSTSPETHAQIIDWTLLSPSPPNGSSVSTNRQRATTPFDILNLAACQDSGDTMDDFELPVNADFTDSFNPLEDIFTRNYEWDVNIFGNQNSDYLMNLLDGELQLPTAGLTFKDNKDQNKGLERPGSPD